MMFDETRQVSYIDLRQAFSLYQAEYEEAALSTLRSGWYILGQQLRCFEEEFASFVGVSHCVGVGNGQEALILALRALGIGPGDQVICAGNTFIATVFGITENGAQPVFVDCNQYCQIDETLVEQAITDRTKAVLITNLYGQCCNLPRLKQICDEYHLFLVEDCAQSHGSSFRGVRSGTAGVVSCFSFYPTKPLGAFGDGGAVVTDDLELAEKVRSLRNYGSLEKNKNDLCGINSRLDELQAALLRVNLSHFDELTAWRVRLAKYYDSHISNPHVVLQKTCPQSDNVFHIYPIFSEKRDELRAFLLEKGIQTQIHYPIVPYKQKCFEGAFANFRLPNAEKFAQQELSLPLYAGMSDEDAAYVVDAVNSFAL